MAIILHPGRQLPDVLLLRRPHLRHRQHPWQLWHRLLRPGLLAVLRRRQAATGGLGIHHRGANMVIKESFFFRFFSR